METAFATEDQSAEFLAALLCEFAPPGTRANATNKTYAALLAPQSEFIAASVYRRGDFTWFYLDEQLKQELENEGFYPRPWKASSELVRDKSKFQLKSLRADDVRRHAELFRRVLKYSTDKRDLVANRVDQ